VLESLRGFAKQRANIPCDELGAVLRRATRINERIAQHQEADSINVPDPPAELDFSSDYKHLTEEQTEEVKEALRPEAGFFMRGKYPKVIRSKVPVTIDTGKQRHAQLATADSTKKSRRS